MKKMKKENCNRKQILFLTFLLSTLILISCNNQQNGDTAIKTDKEVAVSLNDYSGREMYGQHDKLHYLSNYLENKPDTLIIQYRFDLCLCPKWYILETNEPIWVESIRYHRITNYSNREINLEKRKVVGRFYKYNGVPLNLYDFEYLSEKDVPNARIFNIENELIGYDTIK